MKSRSPAKALARRRSVTAGWHSRSASGIDSTDLVASPNEGEPDGLIDPMDEPEDTLDTEWFIGAITLPSEETTSPLT